MRPLQKFPDAGIQRILLNARHSQPLPEALHGGIQRRLVKAKGIFQGLRSGGPKKDRSCSSV